MKRLSQTQYIRLEPLFTSLGTKQPQSSTPDSPKKMRSLRSIVQTSQTIQTCLIQWGTSKRRLQGVLTGASSAFKCGRIESNVFLSCLIINRLLLDLMMEATGRNTVFQQWCFLQQGRSLCIKVRMIRLGCNRQMKVLNVEYWVTLLDLVLIWLVSRISIDAWVRIVASCIKREPLRPWDGHWAIDNFCHTIVQLSVFRFMHALVRLRVNCKSVYRRCQSFTQRQKGIQYSFPR